MSLGITAHVPGEGSILLTDSVTRKGDIIIRDSRKNFRIPSIRAGVFVSGQFDVDVAAMVAQRNETDFDEAGLRLFVDLAAHDQTHEPYAPQLLVVTAEYVRLITPDYVFGSSDSVMLAAGGWVSWHLAFRGIKINSERYRFPTENMPRTLDGCRAYMRELAWACTRVYQNPPLVAAPLYELTFVANNIIEERLT